MKNPPPLEPFNVPLLQMVHHFIGLYSTLTVIFKTLLSHLKFIDEVGNILPKNMTGFCAKHQRKIKPVYRRSVKMFTLKEKYQKILTIVSEL